MCDFRTLNQEGLILKVVSVGLEAEFGSQASSKVKKKKERLYLGLGCKKHKAEPLLLSL